VDKVEYSFDYNSTTIELQVNNTTKLLESSCQQKSDISTAINPLIKFEDITAFMRHKISSENNNFDNEYRSIISRALEGSKNYRIFLLHSIKNSGLSTKRIAPFTIHCTKQFNSRNSVANSDKCSKSQFSFVEILYKNDDGDDVTWLARTAFLICIEAYNHNKELIKSAMMGGFIFLDEKKKVKGETKNSIPYKIMTYKMDPKNLNMPELDLIPLEMISAPTFVAQERNDKWDSTLIHESTLTRSDQQWKKQSFIWINFDWTRRDDNINSMETESNEEEEEDAYFRINNEDINNMNDDMRQLMEDNDGHDSVNEDNNEQDDDTSAQITTSICQQLPPPVRKKN
jgi:hypothetical protein